MTSEHFDAEHIHTTPEGRHFRHGDGVEVDGDNLPIEKAMKKFLLSDDQAREIIEAESMIAAKEQAEENWQNGDWDGKCLVTVRVAELDEEEEETGEVEYIEVECGDDPAEPECTDEDGHDWQADVEVVGGIKDNPGVWIKGGTTMVCKTCCCKCGQYKRETHHGSQRNPGQVDQVEYLPADEASLTWIAERNG